MVRACDGNISPVQREEQAISLDHHPANSAACKLPRTIIANEHRFLIRSTSHSWREYLEYLETEVETDVFLSYMVASPLLPLTNRSNRIVGLD